VRAAACRAIRKHKDTVMSRTPRSSRRPTGLFLLAGLTMLGILAAVLLPRTPATPAATAPPAGPHFVDVGPATAPSATTRRTLVIATDGQVLPGLSGTGGVMLANLVRGQLPAGVAQAVVRSDANCDPDQQGVSHCFNELDFGTSTVMVQHHHVMSTTPCLTPGETVRVLTLDQYHGG